MKNAYKFSQSVVLGRLSAAPASAVNGAIYYNTVENKFKVYENGAWQTVVSGTVDLSGLLKADGSVPLTADWNVDGFKVTGLAAPTDNNDAARKIYVDSAISSAIGAIDYPVDSVNGQTGVVVLDAGDIGYSNTVSGLVATTVQAAIDEVEGRLDTAESAISNHINDAADAHAASAITNTPSGNLAATDVQGALNELQSDVDSRIPSSEKGANNGVATLDAGGKVPANQLPSTVMEYLGVWNASTNTPILADGAGDTGNVYRVSVAGTQNLGSGAISFEVGDYVIYNGTIWEKSDTTDAVASVNGQQGIVVLDTDDISEGATNKYFSDAAAKAAAVVNSTAGTETDRAASVSAMKSYVTGAISSATGDYLPLAGGTMTGDIDMDSNNITNAAGVGANLVTTEEIILLNLVSESAISGTYTSATPQNIISVPIIQDLLSPGMDGNVDNNFVDATSSFDLESYYNAGYTTLDSGGVDYTITGFSQTESPPGVYNITLATSTPITTGMGTFYLKKPGAIVCDGFEISYTIRTGDGGPIERRIGRAMLTYSASAGACISESFTETDELAVTLSATYSSGYLIAQIATTETNGVVLIGKVTKYKYPDV